MPAGIPHPTAQTRRHSETRRRPSTARKRHYKASHHGDITSNDKAEARPLSELGAEPGHPESWEAAAVDLTTVSNAEKNHAWRHLKNNAPELAEAIKRDMPKLKEHWPNIGVWVPREYTTTGESK